MFGKPMISWGAFLLVVITCLMWRGSSVDAEQEATALRKMILQVAAMAAEHAGNTVRVHPQNGYTIVEVQWDEGDGIHSTVMTSVDYRK